MSDPASLKDARAIFQNGGPAAVAGIDAVRAATGAHVAVIHHCGKDEARGARGHSSLRAAVDTEIEISRADGETISTVRVTKQRDMAIGDPLPFSGAGDPWDRSPRQTHHKLHRPPRGFHDGGGPLQTRPEFRRQAHGLARVASASLHRRAAESGQGRPEYSARVVLPLSPLVPLDEREIDPLRKFRNLRNT